MHEHARALAERVRFSGDLALARSNWKSLPLDRAHSVVAASGVGINQELMPDAFLVLKKTCSAIGLDPSTISAYVHASSEPQAHCFLGEEGGCLLRISSFLLQLMSPDELTFVFGHELGHFLLRHQDEGEWGEESAELGISRRAKEISADRVGLLACKSLESAVRAIMKSAAGLGDEFLRFDVQAFLAQLRRVDAKFQDRVSTHPSLLMRCRALVWFSLSQEFFEITGGGGSDQTLRKIDQMVRKDLERFVDGPARDAIELAKNDVELWLLTAAAVRKGSLNSQDRTVLEDTLGEETTKKLVDFLKELSQSAAVEEVDDRLCRAIAEYRTIAPREFRSSFPDLVSEASRRMKNPDLQSQVALLIA